LGKRVKRWERVAHEKVLYWGRLAVERVHLSPYLGKKRALFSSVGFAPL